MFTGLSGLVRNFVLACLLFISALTLSIVTMTFVSPFIYRLFNGVFQLHQAVNLSEEALLHNYSTIVNYLFFPQQTQLVMPDFSASESGLNHFADVKVLMQISLFIACLSTLVSSYIIAKIRNQRQKLSNLRAILQLFMAFPVIMLSLLIFRFDRAFVVFHQIFFRDDSWYFDPLTDPIIRVLPTEFFLLMGLVILLSYCVIYFVYYHLLAKKFK